MHKISAFFPKLPVFNFQSTPAPLGANSEKLSLLKQKDLPGNRKGFVYIQNTIHIHKLYEETLYTFLRQHYPDQVRSCFHTLQG